MARYTIDDLMILAGIDHGTPRVATLVDSDEPPYPAGRVINADEGDEFDLTYDDGYNFVTVRVTI